MPVPKVALKTVFMGSLGLILITVIYLLWLRDKNFHSAQEEQYLDIIAQKDQQIQNLTQVNKLPSPLAEDKVVNISDDGSLRAILHADYQTSTLTFSVMGNYTNNLSGTIDPTIDVEWDDSLWSGMMPVKKTTDNSGNDVVKDYTKVAFSLDGSKVALKAPDQTIHLWDIQETVMERPDHNQVLRQVTVKKLTKIKSIERLPEVNFSETDKRGMGYILFSGNSHELYGRFLDKSDKWLVYQLYPNIELMPAPSKDVHQYYNMFVIPQKPGFGYVKTISPGSQLMHWLNNNYQAPLSAALAIDPNTILISPDSKYACVEGYSDRMFAWTRWTGSDGMHGSVNESRVYKLGSGQELPLRLFPRDCRRWIDNHTLLLDDRHSDNLLYSLDINTEKLSLINSDY